MLLTLKVLLIFFVAFLFALDEPVFIIKELDGLVKDFQWLTETIGFARTDKLFYVTNDGGKTWTSQNVNLCATFNCVSKTFKSNVDPRMVFLVGSNDDSWFTENIGESPEPKYTKVRIVEDDKPRKILDFDFHPTDKNKFLALAKSDKDEHGDLYYSNDRGNSWKRILEDVVKARFGIPEQGNYMTNLVLGIYHRDPGVLELEASTKTYFTMDAEHPFYVNTQLSNAEELFAMEKFLFVATLDKKNTIGLHVTTNNGHSFKKVKLPFEELKENAYTLLDTSEGAVFLNVFHNQFSGEPWGNVYLSDSSGSRYAVSLYHNRRSGSSCDFHKIKSMEGVYVANVVGNILTDEACQKCSGYLDCNEKCQFISKITFDKGGQWRDVGAPFVDSYQHPVRCTRKLPDGRCPLHVHGFASEGRSAIQSHRSAVGLIMANGNTGPYLQSSKSGETNTYFSRDAGLTWEEVAKGPHVFDFMDHGGIMVMARSGVETNVVSYSWNEGAEWEFANFTADETSAISIRKLRVPPNPITKSLVVEGIKNFNSILVYVDFSSLHKRVCQGLDNPSDPAGDYEFFRPHTYETKCFLGRKIEYVRRKRMSQCFNPQVQEKPLKIANCLCAPENYECDFGFESKMTESGQFYCQLMPGMSLDTLKQAPNPCYGTYNETRGYRKVPGDSCIGGEQLYDPLVRNCPASFGFIAAFLLLVFGCIVVSLFLVCLIRGTPVVFRKFFSDDNIGYNPLGFGEGDTSIGIIEEEEDEPQEVDEEALKKRKKQPVEKEQDLEDNVQQLKVEGVDSEIPLKPESDSQAEDFKVVSIVKKQ